MSEHETALYEPDEQRAIRDAYAGGQTPNCPRDGTAMTVRAILNTVCLPVFSSPGARPSPISPKGFTPTPLLADDRAPKFKFSFFSCGRLPEHALGLVIGLFSH